MRHRPRMWDWVEREEERDAAAAPAAGEASTPLQRLTRAAKTGGFEAIVAKARPKEPPKMVTPEEREAELRAAGKWPADKPVSKPAPQPAPPDEPPPRELTPNEQYIAEHCRWRLRGPNDYRPRHREGRCLTEYDVLTGEIIGDGYAHDDEDDEW